VHSLTRRWGSAGKAEADARTPGPANPDGPSPQARWSWHSQLRGVVSVPRPPRRARPVHIVIVCQAAGLTTAAYSFGYVSGWSGGDASTVKATAERVTACARTILDRTGLLGSSLEEAAERRAAA